MATVFSEQRPWDLAAFAEFYLGELPKPVRPRDPGPACKRFIDLFRDLLGSDLARRPA